MTVLFLVTGITIKALFQTEFHVPFFCPFIEFVKIFVVRRCVCLRLNSYIHYGDDHQQSLTVEVILSGMSLM